MNSHKNARMTPFGRGLLVRRVREQNWRVAVAAQAAGVSERTAYRWLARKAAMQPWLAHYNSQRPHSALKHISPQQRLNNLLGNDI